MVKIKQYKNRITRFLTSDNGQRFFNFAYSIGAAIVIWGALFKILHLPGGNFLLSLGMGTEVLMFILSAFDRPPREYHWEEVFPAFDKESREEEEEEAEEVAEMEDGVAQAMAAAGLQGHGGGGSTVIVAGGAAQPGGVVVGGGAIGAPASQASASQVVEAMDVATATAQYLEQMNALSREMEKLHDTTASLNRVSDILLESYRAITDNSGEITEASRGYVAQMKDLNHNIGGLNTIYEIQLKSVSSQLDAIDRVNRGIKDIRDMYEKSSSQSARYMEETEKMARYMAQLNSIYEKMITAMTINMYHPGMAQAAPQAPQADPVSNV